MWDGKKSTALKFYDAIDIIEAKSKMCRKPSLDIWKML
jgi:ribosomal protein S7